MKEEEIIKLWKSGLTKNKLAEIYKRQYNQKIRIIRANIRHRHDGKIITKNEALREVEKAIYKYLKKNN